MAFQFRLQAVLRVRQSFEKQEEQKLAAAVGEVTRLRTMLARTREQLTSTVRRLSRLLAGGTTGADLHLLHFEQMLVERRQQALAATLSIALKKVQEQQSRLQEARKKRKALEELREKQLALFLLTEGRREQQKLDDAFLLRRFAEESGKGIA